MEDTVTLTLIDGSGNSDDQVIEYMLPAPLAGIPTCRHKCNYTDPETGYNYVTDELDLYGGKFIQRIT